MTPQRRVVSKTARWLDLIAFLLYHRFPVPRDRIFRNVAGYRPGRAIDPDPATWSTTERESARRKFERDKDELRAMGIAIETVTVPQAAGEAAQQGYRLREVDVYLPYLELADAPPPARADRPYHLHSVTVSHADLDVLDRATRRLAERQEYPLASAARSLRRKLAFDLPVPLARVEHALAEPLGTDATNALAVLQEAVADRRAVRCSYYSIGRDVVGERELEPRGLFFNWGRWYCVASERHDDRYKVFRVDRIRGAEPVEGAEGRFPADPTFRIHEFLGRSAWELSDAPPTAVTVEFRFPESRWVMAQGVGDVVDPLTEDGGAVLRFQVHDTGPFLRWLLTFRTHATVCGPSSIAQELDALRSRVANLYQPRGGPT
jgi:proteasome accessory factor B